MKLDTTTITVIEEMLQKRKAVEVHIERDKIVVVEIKRKAVSKEKIK